MRALVFAFLAFLAFRASPACADVPAAVNEYILPSYATFADTTAALSDMAMATCDPVLLQPAWNTAFDAWLAVAHLRLGPVEDDGRALAIAFWPDPKGLGAKQQTTMITTADPIGLDPVAFAEASIAVRGLTGLERLLYPTTPPDRRLPLHAHGHHRRRSGPDRPRYRGWLASRFRRNPAYRRGRRQHALPLGY